MSQCTATSSINFNFQDFQATNSLERKVNIFLQNYVMYGLYLQLQDLHTIINSCLLLRLNPRTSHLMSQKHKVECYLLKLLQDW